MPEHIPLAVFTILIDDETLHDDDELEALSEESDRFLEQLKTAGAMFQKHCRERWPNTRVEVHDYDIEEIDAWEP